MYSPENHKNQFTSLRYTKTGSSLILTNVTLVLLSSFYVPGLFISSGHVMRPPEVLAGKIPKSYKTNFPADYQN